MGKKYIDSAKLVDKSKAYDPAEALDLVCQTSKAKFDETIELTSVSALTPVTQTSRSEAQ